MPNPKLQVDVNQTGEEATGADGTPFSPDNLIKTHHGMEESQEHIAQLLMSLDADNNLETTDNFGYLMRGMDDILEHFHDNHGQLHEEISEILESSRHGLLTHEQLSELFANEQMRSAYVLNVVSGIQEHMGEFFQSVQERKTVGVGEEDPLEEEALQMGMDYMKTSIETIGKVITSPIKNVKRTIQRVDSTLKENKLALLQVREEYRQASLASPAQHNKVPKTQINPFEHFRILDAATMHHDYSIEGADASMTKYQQAAGGSDLHAKIESVAAGHQSELFNGNSHKTHDDHLSPKSKSHGATPKHSDHHTAKHSDGVVHHKDNNGKAVHSHKPPSSSRPSSPHSLHIKHHAEVSDAGEAPAPASAVHDRNLTIPMTTSIPHDERSLDDSMALSETDEHSEHTDAGVGHKSKKKKQMDGKSHETNSAKHKKQDHHKVSHITSSKKADSRARRGSKDSETSLKEEPFIPTEDLNTYAPLEKGSSVADEDDQSLDSRANCALSVAPEAPIGAKATATATDSQDVAMYRKEAEQLKQQLNTLQAQLEASNTIASNEAAMQAAVNERLASAIKVHDSVNDLKHSKAVEDLKIKMEEAKKEHQTLQESFAQAKVELSAAKAELERVRYLEDAARKEELNLEHALDNQSFGQKGDGVDDDYSIQSGDDRPNFPGGTGRESKQATLARKRAAKLQSRKAANKGAMNYSDADEDSPSKYEQMQDRADKEVRHLLHSVQSMPSGDLVQITAPRRAAMLTQETSTDDLEDAVRGRNVLGKIKTVVNRWQQMHKEAAEKKKKQDAEAVALSSMAENGVGGTVSTTAAADDGAPAVQAEDTVQLTIDDESTMPGGGAAVCETSDVPSSAGADKGEKRHHHRLRSHKRRDDDQLQMVANYGNGVMVTRTYRAFPEDPRFAEELEKSDNPLVLLHQEYGHILSKINNTRLLGAAFKKERITKEMPQNSSFQKLLSSLLVDILKSQSECDLMAKLMDNCETIVKDLVCIVKATPAVPFDYINEPLNELYSKFGEIESLKLVLDVKLTEFRSMFEKINQQGQYDLHNMRKECHEFDVCYKFFLACQGKSLEVLQRLSACKERCDRYNFLQPNLPVLSNEAKIQIAAINMSRYGSDGSGGVEQKIGALENKVVELTNELQGMQEEMEEMEVELFETLQGNDKTPAALLFFSLMSDPAFVQNLQQICLQLRQLKGFVDGSQHMDFITLRKRLQVCVVCVPSVEKLLTQYGVYYKKWAVQRMNWFQTRNMVGGSAESFNYCALCFHDSSKTQSEKDAGSGAGKKLTHKTLKQQVAEKKAQQRQKWSQQQQQQPVRSTSASNLPPIGAGLNSGY